VFNEFEQTAEKLYNNAKDDNGVVTINMRNKKPVNDPKCKHEFFLDERDADASWVNVYRCKFCPVGQLVKK